MPGSVLEDLIADAELVANAGIRLGRIKDLEILVCIENAKAAVLSGGPSSAETVALQHGVSIAMSQMAPITLSDLRGGWMPFDPMQNKNISTALFALFSLLLLFSTAYVTQAYHRASQLYQTTLELQDTRGGEQAVRLFGLLKKNQKDVVESLQGGTKDFLYESFNKSLSDLASMNVRAGAYLPLANESLCELDFSGRLLHAIASPFQPGILNSTAASKDQLNCYSPQPANYIIPSQYKKLLLEPSSQKEPVQGPINPKDPGGEGKGRQLDKVELQSLLSTYFASIRNFTSSINVGFDPLAPFDYTFYRFRFQEQLSLLSSWVLPGLYGMLGAVIFLMRRILDPTLPSPTWLRFPFRVILGGFAGIIVVWFFSPASNQTIVPAFASLGSFGLAFVIGYSTDFFFLVLDRLVNYMSEAVQKSKT